ncbi:MAG TPA: MFS transporter [Candidatus Methylomirabilis sp.]
MSDAPKDARGRGLWLLSICAARVGANMVVLNYATAIPVLRPAWGMTAARAGLVQTVFLIGYSLSLVGASAAADRWGARRIFVVSSVAGAACAILFGALAADFLSALVLYGLVGLVSGGGYTPGLMLVATRYEGPRRGRAMGLFLGAMSLGNAASVACTGLLLSALGWRAALLLTALGPVAAAGLSAVVVRGVAEPPRGAAPGWSGVRETLRNRAGMLINWAYTFHAWELLGMWGWTPAFLTAAAAAAGAGPGVAVAVGANLTAGMHLVGLLSSSVSGALSDRWGRTGMSLALLASSAACSFAFGWLVGQPLGLVLAVGAVYSFAIIGDSAIYSTAITELVPARILGTTLALRSLIGYTAGAVAPAAFGLVLDATNPPGAPPRAWGWAFASLGAGALPGLWALARLRAMPEARAMAGGRR